jgi:uncharacterized OB-fold protein
MALKGELLGMTLYVDDTDIENLEYFQYCAKGDFRLQKCKACGLLRYPPGTACPWCAKADFEWASVEPKGEVYSYGEVHHAIQPSFRPHTPYMILLVELDTQKGQPSADEGLRIAANLVTADGELAPPEMVRRVGIGSRLRMVFVPAGDGLAIPQWTIDESAPQPEKPWRYPQE